jgi:sugar phosphate isomerase/epimerase
MDAIVYFVDKGVERQARPCGEGVFDWPEILTILRRFRPSLHLSIENRNGHYPIDIFDPAWQANHPDLTIGELAEVVRLARVTEEKIRRSDWEDPISYERVPWSDRSVDALQTSARFLRETLAHLELASG